MYVEGVAENLLMLLSATGRRFLVVVTIFEALWLVSKSSEWNEAGGSQKNVPSILISISVCLAKRDYPFHQFFIPVEFEFSVKWRIVNCDYFFSKIG